MGDIIDRRSNPNLLPKSTKNGKDPLAIKRGNSKSPYKWRYSSENHLYMVEFQLPRLISGNFRQSNLWQSNLAMDNELIGGLEYEFYFSTIYGIILPVDFHMFQRGRSTTNQ